MQLKKNFKCCSRTDKRSQGMFIIPVIIVSTYMLITRPKAMHHNRERKEIISNSIHGPKSQSLMFTYSTPPPFRCQIFLPSDLQSLFCLQFWCVSFLSPSNICIGFTVYIQIFFVSMLFCIYTLREIAASLYKANHGLLYFKIMNASYHL